MIVVRIGLGLGSWVGLVAFMVSSRDREGVRDGERGGGRGGEGGRV